jgi:hypothetical protein
MRREVEVRDAWIDFNDVQGEHTTTLLKVVEPGVSLGVGATLVVGDYDHDLCDATVTAIDGSVVHLGLNLGTFRSSPEDPAATGD